MAPQPEREPEQSGASGVPIQPGEGSVPDEWLFEIGEIGGALLVAATVVALAFANSPWWESYAALRDREVGPESLHLHLSLGTWAADGLLAIFFFVGGLELKREFVAGDLRVPRRAALWPRDREAVWFRHRP
jgi:Na+/H+ antiporter NhaA